jgi:hypothetical protein
MDDRTSDVSPWDVSQMDSRGHHPESPLKISLLGGLASSATDGGFFEKHEFACGAVITHGVTLSTSKVA